MRQVILAMLLLGVLLAYNSNANAYPIEFTVKGTVSVTGATDDLGWSGQAFAIQYLIDSDKPYYTSVELIGNYIGTGYIPDIATLTIGTQAQSFTAAQLTLYKYTDIGGYRDTVNFAIYNSNENWRLTVGASYDYCYLGDPIIDEATYIALPDYLSTSDAVTKGGAVLYPFTEAPPPIYDLSVNQIQSAPVPEPTTMLLLCFGLVGLAGFARKRFKK